MLGKAAVYADPAMLEVTNLDHASPATILFQRGSVITTDIVLALGAKQCAQVGGLGYTIFNPCCVE